MEFQLDRKLRDLRKEQNMSIQTLSDASGVSTGQISQIEHGKVTPSVICLWKLANVLNVDLNYFFEEEPACFVQKPGERKVIVTNEGTNTYELLSPSEHRNKIDFVRITLAPHVEYSSDDEGVTHEGEEGGYVLKGRMVVHLDGKDIVLEEGDSIYYSSKRPHYYANPFDEECISIWCMSPLFF